MTTPDVSVVVTVYNTRPYLMRCLRSVLNQTIGPDRVEIIAVDDGSTDGGGRLLDRLARRHPGVVRVIHQANSGGPAGPCNRALDVATGRFVFFVGSDDYLGPDALRRLVAAADALGSDVVLGKVVGVNSRSIYQDIFARTETDIALHDSPLPRSLANTKLFRRDMIDRHRIRYLEHMPVGSDLPFTLEACYRARRISVLADYEYYFLVRRLGAGNITYTSAHRRRLPAIEAMLEFTVKLIEPGKERDAVVLGRFQHEIARLLDDTLLTLDRPTQQFVHDGVGRLVATYLSDDLADRLAAETRIRAALTRHGELDDLLAVIRQDARRGIPSTVVDGRRRFAAYPGFRGPRLPDDCFDVTTAADWPAKLDAVSAAWGVDERGERRLTVTAHSPAPDLPSLGADRLAAHAEGVPARVKVVDSGHDGTTVRLDFSVADLLDASASTGQRRTITVTAGSSVDGALIRAPGLGRVAPLLRRRGVRLHAVAVVRDESGRLVISVVPVTPRRILARLPRLFRRLPT